MRSLPAYLQLARLGSAAALALVLGACGGGNDSPSTLLNGTAAVGAPLVGSTVSLSCRGGASSSTTTDNAGKWSRRVGAGVLPCAVRVSGGTTGVGGAPNTSLFFSISSGQGGSVVVNVSPLTSLALAGSVGATLDNTWFNALNDTLRTQLAAGLAAAIADLQTALAGYNLPEGFNPFAVLFTAGGTDVYDQLLEQLKQAIADAGTDYNALLAAYAAGGDLPPAPEVVEEICSTTGADDKLGFTNNPTDFCVFNKGASSNSIENYYQFTSTAGTHGTTYVKFNMNGDSVLNMAIENDDYAFGCGVGAQAACTGITFSGAASYVQFSMNNTVLTAVTGTTQALTVNGLVIHLIGGSGGTGGSDTITQSTLSGSEYGVRFATNGNINGSAESGVQRFYTNTAFLQRDGSGLFTEATVNSDNSSTVGFFNLPNAVGTYSCGGGTATLYVSVVYPANLPVSAAQSYNSVSTTGVSGFNNCSVTVTAAATYSGANLLTPLEGTFTARLIPSGSTPTLSESIVVSGTFRMGNPPF